MGRKIIANPSVPTGSSVAGPAEPCFCSLPHCPSRKDFGDAQPKHVPPFTPWLYSTSACDAAGSLARVPVFSPCSHCSLAEHIASSSAFLHTQMSPGALLELAPGGSSALWAPRAGVSAPAPLQPCGTQGTVPSPLAQHAEGPAV